MKVSKTITLDAQILMGIEERASKEGGNISSIVNRLLMKALSLEESKVPETTLKKLLRKSE